MNTKSMAEGFQRDIQAYLELEANINLQDAGLRDLYQAVSKAAMKQIREKWENPGSGKRACYFSAEFLLGRMIYSNLLNMKVLDSLRELFADNGLNIAMFEEVEDAALGNGGLGRLAACFLDSAATQSIPMDGFGIRYRYGLFKQYFQNGFQREEADGWECFGDPWSVRWEDEKVRVEFGDQSVYAVPYDMPVIGYDCAMINTLRLWQAEPVREFDFPSFNEQRYEEAFRERNEAEMLSDVLYPNDDTDRGKRLRLKQQYFFVSASLQCLMARYEARYGREYSHFPEVYAVQLNDTHPTVAIPELLRLFMERGELSYEEAFPIVRSTFAYTNHTIMAEALEKWDVGLFMSVLPQVYPYIVMLQNGLFRELKSEASMETGRYAIIENGRLHMARMAIYGSHSVNGVAELHTEILKRTALPEWYRLYPQRFNNKTNGITQRRWLALCNPELAALITRTIGEGWLTDLQDLEKLRPYGQDSELLRQYAAVKRQKKEQLSSYLQKKEGVCISPDFMFDIQVKRLHEYKRQLMNALSILDLYFGVKDGRVQNFYPTAFLFGAKAAPGYVRAKGIIKFIQEIALKINADPQVQDKMKVLFVTNYNVSYAEKLIPAADVSEQISAAGTEASGTSNMKFMLNGAVTLGTYDGANIEIVEQAGMENNYIFGARVEDLDRIKGQYDPRAIYEREPRVKAVLDTLVDGTFSDGGSGVFRELYDSILYGASWHTPDHYYILLDLLPYCDARMKVNADYKDREDFTRKCFYNTAGAGKFSSDRTILQYAREIWGVTPNLKS